MKVAIVGTSRLDSMEEDVVRCMINRILDSYSNEVQVLSGGAKGVDSLAEEVAIKRGLHILLRLPSINGWKGYQDRNLQIAEECDELYCITTPVHTRKCYHHSPPADHEKTAGCWTKKRAEMRNKECHLLIAKIKNI